MSIACLEKPWLVDEMYQRLIYLDSSLHLPLLKIAPMDYMRIMNTVTILLIFGSSSGVLRINIVTPDFQLMHKPWDRLGIVMNNAGSVTISWWGNCSWSRWLASCPFAAYLTPCCLGLISWFSCMPTHVTAICILFPINREVLLSLDCCSCPQYCRMAAMKKWIRQLWALWL